VQESNDGKQQEGRKREPNASFADWGGLCFTLSRGVDSNTEVWDQDRYMEKAASFWTLIGVPVVHPSFSRLHMQGIQEKHER